MMALQKGEKLDFDGHHTFPLPRTLVQFFVVLASCIPARRRLEFVLCYR